MKRAGAFSGWIGVALLLLACVIGSLTFPRNFLWFFESSVSFVPDLLSGAIAALALYPLWRKGELAAPFDGLLALVALLPLYYLCAILVNIGLGGSGPGLLKLPLVWLLLLILLLANINFRKYAELSLIVLLFLATWNILEASNAMGKLGFPFLAAALFGIVLTFDQRKIFREVLGGTSIPIQDHSSQQIPPEVTIRQP